MLKLCWVDKRCRLIRNQSYIWYEDLRQTFYIKLQTLYMKPGSITNGKSLLIFLFVSAIAFGLVSWDHQQKTGRLGQYQQVRDTVPQKKEKKIRDLDEAIAELEHIDLKEHLDKAMKEVNAALKQLDTEKMRHDIEKSMKEIDFDKIKLDIDKAMKEVDEVKIEHEIKESMAKIDFDELKAELENVKKIDMAEIDAELAKARKELEKAGPQIEKELKKTKLEIEKAKVEMKEYKSFVDGLANDGLINKKEGYSIKHKDGKLTINDKEANAKTYNKYRSFLERHKKFNIEKDLDDFELDTD